MFVKIVEDMPDSKRVTNSKGDTPLTRPSKTTLFEGDKISYQKAVREYDDYGAHVGTYVKDNYLLILGPEAALGDEIIIIEIDNELTVIATACSVYVMNDDGKTVDSIVCPGGQPGNETVEVPY